MRLQADVLRYMTKGEFRVLTAVEMGMKNHEFVSAQLIEQIAGLRRHSIRQILSILLKNKLIFHCSKSYDGYKLTYLGYDYLALNALLKRGLIKGVGVRVGVGKESDIHLCEGEDGSVLVLKLHRLGRISFRSIKKNRDYMQHRTHCSWHYLAHLAAAREFAYLKALHSHGFPVPEPVDTNRHAVLMEYIDAIPLTQVRELGDPLGVLEKLMKLIVRLAHCGLIHGDFNEFNIMISEKGHITMIDLPQMVSIYHPNAALYFDRDVECIKRLFERKFLVDVTEVPQFEDVVGRLSKPPEKKRAAEGNDDDKEEGESTGEFISVSDGLNEQQSRLLESALAERREAESDSPYSGSEDSDDESVSEGSGNEHSLKGDTETEEEEEKGEAEKEEEEKSIKREVESPADSDEGNQQPQSSGSDSSSEEVEEGSSQPLTPEEQQAFIHCWRPAARRHTRDTVRKRVQQQNRKKNSKGNYGSNKNAEGVRARQLAKFDY